jgi:hypothetical protein
MPVSMYEGMKKTVFLLLILVPLFVACDSDNRTVTDYITYSRIIAVPDTLAVDSQIVLVATFDTKMDSIKINYLKLVQQIYLKELSLGLDSPSGGDLSFIRNIEVWISTNGMSNYKIARIDSVPQDCGTSLLFNPEANDFHNYFTMSKSFSLVCKIKAGKILLSDCKLNLKLKIVVKSTEANLVSL